MAQPDAGGGAGPAAAGPAGAPQPAPSTARPSAPMPEPGTWNQFHAEKDGVISVGRSFWEGCKMVYNRGLSYTFQVAHTITLSPEGDKANNYTFAPVFVGTEDNGKGGVDQKVIATAEIGANGTEMAQLIVGPNDPLLLLLVGQSDGRSWAYTQGSAQFTGDRWSSSLTFVRQPAQDTTIYISDFLRRWGDRCTVGAQFMANVLDTPSPTATPFAKMMPLINVAGRWREKDWVATADVGLLDGTFQASYLHYIDQYSAAAACDLILKPQITGKHYPVAKIGVQANFRNAIYKAQYTSEGEVACALDQEIFPPLMFNMNGSLDYATGALKYGVGLTFNS